MLVIVKKINLNKSYQLPADNIVWSNQRASQCQSECILGHYTSNVEN